MFERFAVEKFHGDERRVVLVVNFVDSADVGMIQGRCGFGFALETAEGLGIFGYIVGQELQSHETIEFYVLGLVHHTHSAAAKFLDDAEMRNGLTNQCVGAGHSPRTF